MKRTRDDIIRDILKYVMHNNGCHTTKLMQKVNLSHTQMKTLLNELYTLKYIDIHHQASSKNTMSVYEHKKAFITEKGIKHLINLLISDKIKGLE